MQSNRRALATIAAPFTAAGIMAAFVPNWLAAGIMWTIALGFVVLGFWPDIRRWFGTRPPFSFTTNPHMSSARLRVTNHGVEDTFLGELLEVRTGHMRRLPVRGPLRWTNDEHRYVLAPGMARELIVGDPRIRKLGDGEIGTSLTVDWLEGVGRSNWGTQIRPDNDGVYREYWEFDVRVVAVNQAVVQDCTVRFSQEATPWRDDLNRSTTVTLQSTDDSDSKPGPDPKRLKIEKRSWKEAVKEALGKKKPKEGWPEGGEKPNANS